MRFILIVLLFSCSLLSGISIYDIQYTTNPAGGTYPSPYEGQTVSTGGIITGTDFSNGKFFISSSDGGLWNGIYVYDDNQNVTVGDSVIISAEVSEYYGFTELNDVNYCNIISSGNSLPAPVSATQGGVEDQEQFESVMVSVSNVAVEETYDEYGEWIISDGSGSCKIGIGFLSLQDCGFPLFLDYSFSSLSGIVSYDWGEFKLNPRSLNDIHSSPEGYIISTSDQYVYSPQEFELPIQLIFLGEAQQASSYQFVLHYNADALAYSGYDVNGTLSSGGTLQVEQIAAGTISASFSGDFSFNQIQTLLKLHFSGVASGNGNLEFTSFDLGNVGITYFSVGQIFLQLDATSIGDTLTVIQKPLQNIPALVVPGNELHIQCLADPATTGWNVTLQHDEIMIPLSITNTFYDAAIQRWRLAAEVPTMELYELYDLVVGANGIITDRCKNAVQIIPEFKEDYYFVHITDSHLPTTIFYPDPLSITDTTEVNDLRAVIRDINLIHPEFVLFTGDLVNEGELEDFENRRVYTKAQQLLSEFEVPVFLTSGNHDIGGWNSTPPPQGTARRNWWKFFGWNWLENPPAAEPYYTQNYSFDYGQIHFTGLEAYNNYDSFMYNIYGSDSFTAGQMQWLNDDLQQSSSSQSHVLFYHYDFTEQINLINLGVDMALWGHIHSNAGSITSLPYNLATESTCDGNRAYRIIYVNDAVMQPKATICAGSSGQNLQATFTPENNGTADSLYCFVHNAQPLSFPQAQLKFIMPAEAENYTAIGGTVTQIDESGDVAVCYVSFEIPANEDVSVSVVANTVVSAEKQLLPQNRNLKNYPNPFNPTTTISFSVSDQQNEQIELVIYNLKGQKVKTFSNLHITQSPMQQVTWNGKDDSGNPVTSGVYFYKLKSGEIEISKKMLLMK